MKKTYKISYPANIIIEIEADNEKSALDKGQELTLKTADELKIFIEPVGNEININEI